MKFRVETCLWALIAFCLLWPTNVGARRPAIPKDADGFTAYLSDSFAEAMPNEKVTVEGPLLLKIGAAQVRLNAVWDYCERDRRKCAGAIKDYVAQTSDMMNESRIPVTLKNLRAIVRDQNYVEDIRRSGMQGVMKPIVGRLWLICVIDTPHGVSTLSHNDMAKLGLSEDQAIKTAIENVRSALPSLAAHTHEFKPGLTFATGDFYESSRLLLHDDWAAMSDAMHGHLVVAVPSPDVVIYGNGGGNGDIIVLSDFAKFAFDKAPKQLSSMLLHWTKAGWEPVPSPQ
jgi:uncharacterized protein YtpQ (UPF0354 family)